MSYLAADQKLMSISVKPSTAGGFAFDTPQPLFELPPLSAPVAFGSFRYAVTADSRFLVLMDSKNAVSPPITVVTNWQSTLKK